MNVDVFLKYCSSLILKSTFLIYILYKVLTLMQPILWYEIVQFPFISIVKSSLSCKLQKSSRVFIIFWNLLHICSIGLKSGEDDSVLIIFGQLHTNSKLIFSALCLGLLPMNFSKLLIPNLCTDTFKYLFKIFQIDP